MFLVGVVPEFTQTNRKIMAFTVVPLMTRVISGAARKYESSLNRLQGISRNVSLIFRLHRQFVRIHAAFLDFFESDIGNTGSLSGCVGCLLSGIRGPFHLVQLPGGIIGICASDKHKQNSAASLNVRSKVWLLCGFLYLCAVIFAAIALAIWCSVAFGGHWSLVV